MSIGFIAANQIPLFVPGSYEDRIGGLIGCYGQHRPFFSLHYFLYMRPMCLVTHGNQSSAV